MNLPFIDRIDAQGLTITIAPTEIETALRQGESLHRTFRPNIEGDYATYIRQMAEDGAAITHLTAAGEVQALAVWRTFLTTYSGRRFEIDDLVTAEASRSKGYGATLIRALEAKAVSLSCDAVMLTSATWRTDAHRFYLRERYAIDAFLFSKHLR